MSLEICKQNNAWMFIPVTGLIIKMHILPTILYNHQNAHSPSYFLYIYFGFISMNEMLNESCTELRIWNQVKLWSSQLWTQF